VQYLQQPLILHIYIYIYIINILLSVESVMVDYHTTVTRKKYHTLEKNITRNESQGWYFFPEDIFFRVWSSTITPSTEGSMFFYYTEWQFSGSVLKYLFMYWFHSVLFIYSDAEVKILKITKLLQNINCSSVNEIKGFFFMKYNKYI